MTKILVVTLKVSITVLAIYFLYETDKLEYQNFYRDIINYHFLIISSLLGIAVILVNQIRFWLLINSLGEKVPLTSAIRFGLISWFANSLFMGGGGWVTAESIKMIYLTRSGYDLSKIISAIFFDRFLGVLLIGSISLVCFFSHFIDILMDAEFTSGIGEVFIGGLIFMMFLVSYRRVIFRKADRRINNSLLVVGILIGAISVFLKFYFVAFSIWLTLTGIHTELLKRGPKDRIPKRIKWLIEKPRRFFWEMGKNIAHFKGYPRVVAYGFLCAIFGFVLSVSSIYLLSQVYKWNFDISWFAVMKSLGITNFASTIPLPGNSLGVSEAIFDNSLETFGTSNIDPLGAGVVLYFSYRIQMTVLSLVGLPFFIVHKRVS